MASRRQNPRLARSHLSYTIADAADLYGVHRQTVRNWLANGLEPLDGRKPTMIHGPALNRFHKARREVAQHRCGPGEVFCLGCRAPRRPAGAIADFTPMIEKVGTLSAICPVCGRLMTQRVNAARLAQFSIDVVVAVRPAPEPIKESR
jgi:hypothetical protein